MKRKRFNRAAICNSDSYSTSKRAHKRYIQECHINNLEVISKIEIKQRAYVSVFGKLILITETEIEVYNTLNIIIR